MAILISRRYLIVIFLSSMYQHSIGQCPTGNLRNVVLREGESLRLPQPMNRNCAWSVIPSNSWQNVMIKIANASTGLSPAFAETLTYDPSGLTIIKASGTSVGSSPWSTAGVYMLVDNDAKCNTSNNVLVLNTGPTCQCNASTKTTPAKYNCTYSYAQSPISQMYAQFTWVSVDGKDKLSFTPIARKLGKNYYTAVSTIPTTANATTVGNFAPSSCTVTFAAPPRSPFPSIDAVPPSYTDYCLFKRLNCN